MPDATLKLIPGTLTNTCYPSDPQDLNSDIISKASVSLSSSSFTIIVTSATVPALTDRDKLWYNTNDNRIYAWTGGAWLHKHPYDPASLVRQWWTGTLVQLQTFDGGDVAAAGSASGPMWEEDTDYQGRLALHAGTLPTSGSSVTIGDEGGLDQITLTSENTPEHTHDGKGYVRIANGNQSSDPSGLTDDGFHENSAHTHGSETNAFDEIGIRTTTINETHGEAFDSLNPYRAGIWIKRTSREYYKAS